MVEGYSIECGRVKATADTGTRPYGSGRGWWWDSGVGWARTCLGPDSGHGGCVWVAAASWLFQRVMCLGL